MTSTRAKTVVRVVASGAAALALARGLWALVPDTLKVKTDVVGYPIFANFDANRYFDGYYMFVFVVPALVLGVYLLLGRLGPLRPARALRPAGPMFPVTIAAAPAGPADAPRWGPYQVLGALVRVGVPAVTVGFEISAFRGTGRRVPTPLGLAVGCAYFLVVLVASAAAARRWPTTPDTASSGPPGPWNSRAAELVRAGAALGVVPLLAVVSSSTKVTVASDHHIVHYHWLPVWVVVPATLALALWLGVRARHPKAGAAPGSFERAAVALVVGPVLVFLCVAALPGAQVYFVGFDDAQGLAAAQLTFHGFFPWKDLFFIHGLLSDVFDDGLGMAMFANSRWAAAAGASLVVSAVTVVVFYYFTLYFGRRNRLAVFGVATALVLRLLGGFADRFGLAPVLLILLDVVLRRRSRGSCALLMAVLVVQAIITPEIGLLAVGLVGTVIAFEVCTRTRGAPWREGLFRTMWCAAFGAAFTGAWVVFLAACGALSGFIDYFRIFGPGHTLSGALPIGWSLLHRPSVTVEFFLPVILILGTYWRIAAKLRGRQTWSTFDWTMVAAASWAGLYFSKGLARADIGHVGEVFTVSLPLVLLWAITVVRTGDAWATDLVSRTAQRLGAGARAVRRWVPARLVTCGAIVAVVVASPLSLPALRSTAVHFQAQVPNEPPLSRLGYAQPGAVNVTMLHDLATVFDEYAGTTGPVFDFTNDPGIMYYLLGRVPGSRFYNVSMAIPAYAQRLLISDLEKSRPRLVVFNDETNGLPEWDGVVNMVRHYDVSQYILDHYAPLADVDGQLLMLRSDLVGHVPPLPPLRGKAITTDLYFDAPTCDWGDAPNFLRIPGEPAAGPVTTVPVHGLGQGTVVVSGWAADDLLAQPAREVVAVRNGAVVASVVPQVARPDVVAALHSSAFSPTGYGLALPATERGVALYALNADGTMSSLPVGRGATGPVVTGRAATVLTPDHVTHPVVDKARGSVDSATTGQVLSLDVPARTPLSDDQWLRLTSSSPMRAGTFVLTDVLGDSSHEIAFNALATTGTDLDVKVGSCIQWHGYRASAPLYLVQSASSPVPTVVLQH